MGGSEVPAADRFLLQRSGGPTLAVDSAPQHGLRRAHRGKAWRAPRTPRRAGGRRNPELNLDSSTLTRMQPVQRTALGRAISMRVRMAEMELKRRGMGVGRSGEESRADLDESNRGQTFLADD